MSEGRTYMMIEYFNDSNCSVVTLGRGCTTSGNVGALIITYTILGVPYYSYSRIYPPKPYANYSGPYSRLWGFSYNGPLKLRTNQVEIDRITMGPRPEPFLGLWVGLGCPR